MKLSRQNLQKMAMSLQATDWHNKTATERERRLIDIAAKGEQVISRFSAQAIQRAYEAHCRKAK